MPTHAARSASILLPTRNAEGLIDRVLAALAGQHFAHSWDLQVIDSGSTDRTLTILNAWKARFPAPMSVATIHPATFNHGDTRNLLAARSRGEILVFLTQDAIPGDAAWLQTLLANFDDPRVGAAYSRNVPHRHAGLLTRLFTERDPGYAPGRREQSLPDSAAYAAMDPHQKRLLFNFNNVASAVRRSLWERHPFPRTDFGEDILMARALIESGSTVVYDDKAVVEHSHDYANDEMRERARIDGRFNIEWLGRRNVASKAEAEQLTRRQLVRDREALVESGIAAADLDRTLRQAEDHRRAAFVGMYEGGASKIRRRATRVLPATRLRILYVVHGFPPDTWAGTEVYTLELAQAIQRRGHDVSVMTRVPVATGNGSPLPDFSIDRQEFRGLPVWRMTHGLAHRRLRDSYQQPGAEAAFREVLAQVKPDVVHFQHLIHLSAGLPLICRELGVPTVMTVNDYWALCARVQLIRPDAVRCDENQGLGCLLCVKERSFDQIPTARRTLPMLRPIARAIHALGGTLAPRHLADRAGDLGDIADRHDFVSSAYAACDRLVAPSRFLREKLLATGKYDPANVVYSDYGVQIRRDDGFVRNPDPEGRVRFGFVGSLLWYKGPDLLIRAVKQLANSSAVLNVFGEFTPGTDPFHARLASLAAECGDRVVFHGRFDNSQIARVYEQIDVLVVPSIWFENSPISIHESFQFSTPVVTSDIGGMAELVRDGANGLHFRAGDETDLARVLRRFATEPDLAAKLADFPSLKTMDEDALETEVRYRAVACLAPDRR